MIWSRIFKPVICWVLKILPNENNIKMQQFFYSYVNRFHLEYDICFQTTNSTSFELFDSLIIQTVVYKCKLLTTDIAL